MHLLGSNSDPDAERIYRWHIEERSGPRMRAGLATDSWKCTVDDYVEASYDLLASMRTNGFYAGESIPLDPNGELLNGAHRLACAMALGFPQVPVIELPKVAWAPPWHREWFVEHGMPEQDLQELDNDWEFLTC